MAKLDILRKLFISIQLDKLISKYSKDKNTTSLIGRLVPSNHLYKKPTIRTIHTKGVHFSLDISDHMEWLIYFGLKIEPRKELYSLVSEGDLIIDVGTNVGETLLNFARLTTQKGKVIGFEPDPQIFQKCINNIKLNEFENITLNNKGLSDIDGELFLDRYVDRNRGANKITHSKDGENVISVQITTLDEYLENSPPPQLIKIDVEGHELNVLRGAHETLKKFHPILFIEINDQHLKSFGVSAQELVRFLLDMNYKIARADNNDKITADYNFKNYHFDIICK